MTSEITLRWFDFGRGPTLLRADHPSLPGSPIFAAVPPGAPEAYLRDREAECIERLHDDFRAGFDIL